MKDHVQQHKDYEEHYRQNDLQPLLGANLKLVLARPRVGVARWQREFLVQQIGGLLHETAIVFRVQVDVDVAR